MADYTKYTNKEMQAITLAQQITDDNIAIVGTGLPLIFKAFLKEYVYDVKDNEEFLEKIGVNRLLKLKVSDGFGYATDVSKED